MELYLDGTDISTLKLGLVESGIFTEGPETRECRPEEYLSHIDRYLNDRAIDGLIVVSGPGSATALRAAHALANTLAFAKGWSLKMVRKGDDLSTAHDVPLARPEYEKPPNITMGKQ